MLVDAERILATQFYGSLKLVFSEALGEIQHRPPNIPVHTDDHLTGDLVNVHFVQDLGGTVLLVVLVLQETAHQITDGLLGFRIILVLLTGENVLDRNDNLSIPPLPYVHFPDTAAAFEVQPTDLTLGKLDKTKQKSLGVDSKIVTYS